MPHRYNPNPYCPKCNGPCQVPETESYDPISGDDSVDDVVLGFLAADYAVDGELDLDFW